MEKPEEGMSKFGVSEQNNSEKMEKAASKGCPICAATCVRHGNILSCPTHGTAPFEK